MPQRLHLDYQRPYTRQTSLWHLCCATVSISIITGMVLVVGFVVALNLAGGYQRRQDLRQMHPHMAENDLANLDSALSMFSDNVGHFPTTSQGLEALVKAPPGVKGWSGPYVKSITTDPWDVPYHYRQWAPGNTHGFYLSSSGPDRRPGSSDDLVVSHAPN